MRGGVVAEARVPEGIDEANGAAGEPFEELHDNGSSETLGCARCGIHRLLLSRRREGCRYTGTPRAKRRAAFA